MAAAPPVAKPDRSKPPALGPVRALKLPPMQRLRLSNGVPVLLVADGEAADIVREASELAFSLSRVELRAETGEGGELVVSLPVPAGRRPFGVHCRRSGRTSLG